MKAMIFAAGKGSRLKPLTDHTPKALVKVNGVTMLERIISKLISIGVSEIIVNVHYLADQIIDFLNSKNNFGIRIEISDETDDLLDTGGGLKKASWFFNDKQSFILHNVDVMSNIDLIDMLHVHNQNQALVTLAVRERKSSRYFLFNEELDLCAWENTNTQEKIISRLDSNLRALAFSGIHIINPDLFKLIKAEGSFSIVQTYIEISKNKRIKAYEHTNSFWFDIGDPNKLHVAQEYLKLHGHS